LMETGDDYKNILMMYMASLWASGF
jgi:hypothetical protein